MGNFGMKIRKLRKLNRDSQKELGKKIGYSFGGLAKIERGERKPSIELLHKIADVYDVPISHFIGEEQNLPKELREKGVEWISFIDEMEERDIKPDEIKQIIEFMGKLKD